MEAMKVMAANKIKRTENALSQTKDASSGIAALVPGIDPIQLLLRSGETLPTYLKPFSLEDAPKDKTRHVLLVLMGADKGLCGSFHTQFCKTIRTMAEDAGPKTQFHTYVWGGRTAAAVKRARFSVVKKRHCGRLSPAEKAFQMMQDLDALLGPTSAKKKTDAPKSTKEDKNHALPAIDGVLFLTPCFESALVQTVTPADLQTHLSKLAPTVKPPMPTPEASETETESLPNPPKGPRTQKLLAFYTPDDVKRLFKDMGIVAEPDPLTFLKQFVRLQAGMFFYQAFVESSLCEESARMTAMDTAVRNSNDLLDDINLQYNRTRQAMITNELVEIISGANAL